MCAGRPHGRREFAGIHDVAPREDDDVGEVTFPGRRVTPVDHRHDLLGQHGWQRIADHWEGLAQQPGERDLNRGGRDGVADIDVKFGADAAPARCELAQ